jgi:hypothetical protein
MKKIFLLSVWLTISVVSFGQDKAASRAATPEISPSSSMEETKAWIEHELPPLGTFSSVIVGDDGYKSAPIKREVKSVLLSDCRVSIRRGVAGSPQRTWTETVTLKDVDISKIQAFVETAAAGNHLEPTTYFVPLIAAADRGAPFTSEVTGGGLPTKEDEPKREVRVRAPSLGAANRVADALRRAAVLCGAPSQPVGSAVAQPETTAVAPPGDASKTTGGIYLGYLTRREVPAPDSSKIDSSKVRFLPLKPCSVGFGNTVDQTVMGVVSPELDISDDSTALRLLQMGIKFGQQECPPRGENFQGVLRGRTVAVFLKLGDPATFTPTNLPMIFVASGSGTTYDTPSDEVVGAWLSEKPGLIRSYMNAPKALKQSQAYDAQEAKRRDAMLDQQRQAEQKKQSEIAARSAAFVKANGVTHFVTVQQLTANPFVYQGQVVAIYGVFEQMKSATEGIFSVQDKSFVVSAIPAAKFTQERSMVMLAGRVLGNIEIKLPVLGPTLVPHLSFVGSAFCQEQGCSDYDIKLK